MTDIDQPLPESMTVEPGAPDPGTGQPASQSMTQKAREKLKERARQQIDSRAPQFGQKAGSFAQALRMSSDQMRSQGQEGQGKIFDKVAQRVQLAGGYLSQSNSDSLLSDSRQARPKLREKTQQWRGQAGSRLRQEVDTRSTPAGEKVSSFAQALRTTGEQLRGQGEEGQASMVDRLTQKVEQLGTYLTQSDSERLMGDVRSYGQRIRGSFSKTRQTVVQKGSSVGNRTSTSVKEGTKRAAGVARRKPMGIALGALAGAVIMGRRAAKKGASAQQGPQPEAQEVEVQDVQEVQDVTALEGLSKMQLMERARAAGILVRPNMTKRELLEALRGGSGGVREEVIITPTGGESGSTS